MFNKMIAQQTAKKEKLLDNFLKKHEAEYPFPEDVELICDIDYMGDGKPCHFMDIYRPRKIMKVLPSYIYGKHWKKSSFYPYINPENKEIIRNLPPSFLVTAYGDTLRNYSRQYAKAIKKAGVICHLEDYEVTKNFRMLLVQLFLKWRKVNVQIRRWWNFFLNTDEMPGNLTGVRIRIILPAQGCNRYIQLRTQFS